MSTTVTARRTPVAARLLAAPDAPAGDWRDLPWEAALVADAPWRPWTHVSIWGTRTWDRLDDARRLLLARHETATVTDAGIWAENVLMRMLLRVAAREPARGVTARYALTEVADECRHSLMFARLLEVLDVPDRGPGRVARRLTEAFTGVAHPVEVFASALVVEEILDAFQRAAMRDEEVQPLARAVNRIHVAEEARHISFARDELASRWPRLSAPRRAAYALTIASAATVTASTLVDRRAYAAVGLDPSATARVAARNEHRRELVRTATARLVEDFTAIGVITPASRPLWRAAGLA
jgi:hypothetical protein